MVVVGKIEQKKAYKVGHMFPQELHLNPQLLSAAMVMLAELLHHIPSLFLPALRTIFRSCICMYCTLLGTAQE